MIDENFIPFCINKELDAHKWREKRLWTEECDSLYKIYFNLILYIYFKYSGKNTKPGELNFMSR